MNLQCPACGAPFSADDVHTDLGVANCRTCRGVLDLRRTVLRTTPRPPRFDVDDANGDLTITWRWFRASHLGMLVFSIAWWTFLAGWYSSVLRSPHRDVTAILFPIGHVAAGCFILYSAIAGIFNRTRITVDAATRTLEVTHAPLPWPRNWTLATGAIAELYVQRHSGSKGGDSYSLRAVDKRGRALKLAGGFGEREEPQYLMEQLAGKLNVPMRP